MPAAQILPAIEPFHTIHQGGAVQFTEIPHAACERLYRINGVEDHLHILTSIHPTVCPSDLVKDIKIGTSKWIKEGNVFPAFTHWQDGYGAFTVSHGDKDAVMEYIKGQEAHHKKVSFKDELREFLIKHGVKFDEKYLV